MSETDEFRLCIELLRGCSGNLLRYGDDPIPPEVADTYARHIAARELGSLPKSIVIEAAWCRSALTASEDDRVRVECIQQLLNSRSTLLEAVLFGLLFDADHEIRIASIEGLHLMRSANLELAARLLSYDQNVAVRDLANRAAAGDDIDLYHLDLPTRD
jgi:hypothetical protein